MSGRYGTVFTEIWQDKKFRALSDGGKMLFVYLLSSPHGNMIGYFKLPVQYALHDLDLEGRDTLLGFFEELQEQEIAFYDREEEVVFIKNFLARNPFRNINQIKGAFKQLVSAPYSEYMNELIKVLPKGLSLDCKPETAAVFWEKYEPFIKLLGSEDEETDNPDKGLVRGYQSENELQKGLVRGYQGACNTEQNQNSNQNRTEPEPERATLLKFPNMEKGDPLQEFKIKLSLLLMRKELYNSEVGEQCIALYQNIGDIPETLKKIESYSSRVRSPDDLLRLLEKDLDLINDNPPKEAVP